MIAHLSSLAVRTVTLPFRRGLTGSLATLRYRLREVWYERYLGVRTDRTPAGLATAGTPECIDYEPLSYECLERIVEAAEPGPDRVFIDYGCGLGRAVVLAATKPFARVIGVEYDPDLAAGARANVRRASRRFACSQVEIVDGDASTYQVPDDVSVVYMFNPFTGSVMEAVQSRLFESLERCPRRLRIVYMTPPDQADLFEDVSWVDCVRELPTGHWPGCSLRVYESTVPTPAAPTMRDSQRTTSTTCETAG